MTHAHTTLEKHPICETPIDFEPGAARNYVKKVVRNPQLGSEASQFLAMARYLSVLVTTLRQQRLQKSNVSINFQPNVDQRPTCSAGRLP